MLQSGYKMVTNSYKAVTNRGMGGGGGGRWVETAAKRLQESCEIVTEW